MNKKVKLDNGFISVNDLSDEEIEEMIQLYNDELIEVNKRYYLWLRNHFFL